jgi:hypothetical protein
MFLRINQYAFAVVVFALQGGIWGTVGFVVLGTTTGLMTTRSLTEWKTRGLFDFIGFGSLYAFALCTIVSAIAFAIGITLRTLLRVKRTRLEAYVLVGLAVASVAGYASIGILGGEGATLVSQGLEMLTLFIVSVGAIWIGRTVYDRTWTKLEMLEQPRHLPGNG